MLQAVPQLHDFLIASAKRLPTKVALVVGDTRLTYEEIDRRSDAVARGLVGLGVERGDRVVLFCGNSPETVIAFWAVLKANAIVSIVNPLTKADKLAYMLNDCRAKVLISEAALSKVVQDVTPRAPHLVAVAVTGKVDPGAPSTGPRRLAWDELVQAPGEGAPPRRNIDIDLASIIYTSGSTGEPKGVMLTHRNMITAATSISTYLENTEDDVILGVLPLAFDYGLYQMIMSVRMGARLVLEWSFTFPQQVLRRVVEEKVTGFPGVPTIFATMAEMKNLGEYDFSHIRYVSNTAAALPVKHITMLRTIFPAAKVFSMYGLTECKRCTYLPPKDIDRKPTSVGIAIPNTELWIVDENDNKVGPGVVGQLVIRGATVMKGYWEKPEATARRLKPGPLPGEQVLYTGDYYLAPQVREGIMRWA